ncbi:MAG: thymidine kinase [Gaeavirus sp.]|uniref:Thymidine kinase n=1 Tax=Gaeavirus sp. TaxID=2487767 RepID=A0A3G5A3Q9_9VIRU|nr:MAG: thymidine kinase [Gaeavirus sp.]
MDFSDGKLEIVLGTMFSGKTSFMLSKIAFFADLGFKILYINIEFDTRNTDAFSTHNPFLNTDNYSKKDNIEKNVTMIKCKELTDVPYAHYDIIMIDEAHFFPKIEEYVKELLLDKKYVFVSSLIADFQGNKFGSVYDLIPICDEIHRLHAYCGICCIAKKCRIAIYSKRITSSTATIEIGGSDKYIPVCRQHFLQETIP